MRFSASEMQACTLHSEKVRKFLDYAENELEDTILAAANDGYFSITWMPDDEWLVDNEWPKNLIVALRILLEDNGYRTLVERNGSLAIFWER